ncbi:MAG: hypothetical protein J5956_05090 [Ruminococcus sp.]|nr:hypothetical protein [Ruminococcus sp.]
MRIRAALTAAVMCLGAVIGTASCGRPDIVGDNLIMQAREDFEALDSAKVIMTNTDTDKQEQVFTFKYEGDTLVYSDVRNVDDKISSEYNNGEVNIYYQGEKYYQYEPGDEKFKKYTRSDKHKKAQDDMITYIPSAVTDAKMLNKDDKIEITHVYNVETVKPAVPEGAQATGFAVRYLFDSDGKLESFTESTIYELEGQEHRVVYRTEITEKNSVEKVQEISSTQAK